jgi:hypothetical protein
MSKSQNTKNEQQKDLCITSEQLTEQYKHGNLPDDRLYYYRFKGKPDVQITTQYGLYCEEADNKKEIEVIDFVPSYEEYLSLTYAKEEDEKIIAEYEKENQQLKELLKECREIILDYNHWIMSTNPNDSELILRINEVLNA